MHFERIGAKVLAAARSLPKLGARVTLQPVTNQVLRVCVELTPLFEWSHGSAEPFTVWLGDGDSEHIYHTEHVLLQRRNGHDSTVLAFTIPIREPLPTQYLVHVLSERWIGVDDVHAVNMGRSLRMIEPESW